MTELLGAPATSVFLTLLCYYLAQRLYQRFRWILLNPVLLTVIGLILFLRWSNIPYPRYMEGGSLISFFLGPAVVALGVPLSFQLREIRKRPGAVLLALLAGSLTGIATAAGLAWLLGATREVVFSLAPKSATTPIAIGIVEKIGGLPSLTAALVVTTGLLGGVVGPAFLRRLKVVSPTAFGLAMGAAAHGIGTARALEDGEVQGAMSGLALCVNGLFTALLTPLLLHFFG